MTPVTQDAHASGALGSIHEDGRAMTFQEIRERVAAVLIHASQPGTYECDVGIVGNAYFWVDDGCIVGFERGDRITDTVQWDASAMDVIGPEMAQWLKAPVISKELVLRHQLLDEWATEILGPISATPTEKPFCIGNYVATYRSAMEPAPMPEEVVNQYLGAEIEARKASRPRPGR